MGPTPHASRAGRGRLRAVKAALTYALVGGVWVVLSDRLLDSLVPSHRSFVFFQALKGWFFVALTAVLVYVLVRRESETVAQRGHLERRRTEMERSRLAAAIEQAAEAFIITEPDATIVYANPAFERITGYSREDVMGRTPSVLKSGQHNAEFYRVMWSRLERGEPWSGHLVNRRKDGGLYHAEVVISPIQEADGTIINYVSLQRDVSRVRALEEQLRQAQKMEVVGRLTGGIAHDFKNLLAVVQTNADLLASMLTTAELDATAMVDDLRRAAERGRTLIDKLMAFSRRQQLQVRSLNLVNVVYDGVDTLRPLVPEHIKLSVSAAPNLPRVMADAGAVDQILMNLATNAVDAMPNGGELRIDVHPVDVGEDDEGRPEWLLPGSYICMATADTGGGMDRSVRARVFEPFFTTKALGVGTGLGMAMVYGLVKLQHGFVDVESAPGTGTTVRVYLTVDATGSAPESSSRRPPNTGASREMGGSETILVVEDEPAVRTAAKRALTRYGYRVLLAADGEEAVQIFRACDEEIDLVLSDLTMPKVGGLELYHTLNAGGRSIRFLLASGYGPGGRPPLPDVPFIEKPWTVEQLLTKLREILDAPRPTSATPPPTAETTAPLA